MTSKNAIVTVALSILAVFIGCDKRTAHPNETTLNSPPVRTALPGAETPRALLNRMYDAVENNARSSFHASHTLKGMERELMDNRFDYLVAQANLRRAAGAAYGQDAAASLERVTGGIVFFDTSPFPKAPIEINGDTANATWTDRQSEHQTTTYNAPMRRIEGRWFLVSIAKGPLDAETREWCRKNIHFVQTATLQLRAIVQEVRAGSVKVGELDQRVEKVLRSSGT